MSDGGDTIEIPNIADVVKYYNGVDGAATYKRVNNPGEYSKVYYNGGAHSAITDPNNPSLYVISKWGSGPLVRHLPGDCPYTGYTLEYYDLKIDDSPTSVALGCATTVSTLNISGATYNWSGDNYVCAAATANQYTGSVTGLNTTPQNGKGKVKVEIASPLSNTTVKGVKEFTVTTAPSNPYITGNPIVCSSGTSFNLNNVPSGNAVTWQYSSNLSPSDIHANPCTFTSTGNGSGWVNAVVSTPCGNSTTFQVSQYPIWRGTPIITSISGPASVGTIQPASFTAQLSLDSYPDNYSWTTSPSSGVTIYPDGRYASMSFANSGTYQVVARAHNGCGWSDYFVTYVDVLDGYYLAISPNPTTTEATIELVNTSTEKATEEIEWNLEVYDAMQSMKAKVEKIKNNKQTLNTQGWKEGVYIVRAIIGKDVVTGKLVVKP